MKAYFVSFMGKMVMKQCPQCEQQVPVACKSCPCGHLYFQARRPVNGATSGDASSGVLSAVKKRRGEQLRQLKNANKDNNFSTLNRHKVQRTSISRSKPRTSSMCNSTEDGESAVEETLKKKRGRQKRNPSTEREAGSEKDIHANIPPEQAAKYSVVLAEINRKMCVSSFHL